MTGKGDKKMKMKNTLLRMIRYSCLLCIIIFGLIAIIGSNGGGGDSDNGNSETIDISGYWKTWHTEEGIEVGPEYLTFTQSGNSITISEYCNPEDNPIYGTINNTTISFSLVDDVDDDVITNATGTVSGNTMLGTWSDTDGSSGIWRAEKTNEPECSNCDKLNNSMQISLNDMQIFNFDSETVVTSPTRSNNVIQWRYTPGINIDGDYIYGDLAFGNQIASEYESQLSMSMGYSNIWENVCLDQLDSYGGFWTNTRKDIFEEGNIYLIRLSDGATYIKLQITSIRYSSLEFYYEFIQ